MMDSPAEDPDDHALEPQAADGSPRAPSSLDAQGNWICPQCGRIIRHHALPRPRLHRAAVVLRLMTIPLGIAWLCWLVQHLAVLGQVKPRFQVDVFMAAAIIPILAIPLIEFFWLPRVRKITCRNCGHSETKRYKNPRSWKGLAPELGPNDIFLLD